MMFKPHSLFYLFTLSVLALFSTLGAHSQEQPFSRLPLPDTLHTADPAAYVWHDTLWLCTGHDAAGNLEKYSMDNWLLFATTDFVHWTSYPSPLCCADFAWMRPHKAWAGQIIERGGRFYWYVSSHATGTGVAVSDHITGPYHDALGQPLVTPAQCVGLGHQAAAIDPSVFIDIDGQAYLFWGNRNCNYAPLSADMTSFADSIRSVNLGREYPYTEAVWIYHRQGHYYLFYATGWPEQLAYAMSSSIHGPWQPMGIIAGESAGCPTTHPAVVDFQGQTLIFSHDGSMPDGAPASRSVNVARLLFDPDGSIRQVTKLK